MPTALAIQQQKLKEDKRHNQQEEMYKDIQMKLFEPINAATKIIGTIGSIINDPEFYKRLNFDEGQWIQTWDAPYEDVINSNYTPESGQQQGHTLLNPAFCVLNWVPTIGTKNNENVGGAASVSPISRAITQYFTDERNKNMGYSGQYNQTDYFLRQLAFDSVMTAIGEAERVFELIHTFPDSNWNIPKDMITALGWNYTDIKENQADFRAAIESLVAQANTIAIPNGMSYMDKHLLLATQIYRDQPLRKSHFYIFKCDCFWKYDEVNSRLLRVNPAFSSSNTYKQNLQIIETMIASLQTGTNVTMNGDTLRWCNDLVQIQLNPVDKKVEFNDDINMLLQIFNCDPIGPLYNPDDDCEVNETPDGQDLYQGYVNQAKTISYGLTVDLSDVPDVAGKDLTTKILRCYEDKPSSDAVVEMTRLTAPRVYTSINPGGTARSVMAVKCCGSEVVTTIAIYFRTPNQGLTYFDVWDWKDMNGLVGSTFGMYWNMISRFNYFPLVHLTNGTGPNSQYPYTLCQLGNYTRYSEASAQTNHKTALMSELGSRVLTLNTSFKPSTSRTPEVTHKSSGKKKFPRKKK